MFNQEHSLEILNKIRPVERADFLDEKGQAIWPTIFFIHTFHSNMIEEHHKHKGFDATRWYPWAKSGRMYVKKRIQGETL